MELRMADLLKTYGSVTAVDIPALRIKPGRCFGLVGLNGAGKTTLLRLILDLVKPDRGAVYINGANVAEISNWKKSTGSYLDESFLFPFLSPGEYFQFVGNLYGLSSAEIEDAVASYHPFFALNGGAENQKLIRDLSSGNKQKVGLITAMMIRPKLLILDEPFASLDPLGQEQLKEYLSSLQPEYGTTIVLSSHNLYHVKDVCDRIGIMDQGRIIHDIDSRGMALEDLYDYFQPAPRKNRQDSLT